MKTLTHIKQKSKHSQDVYEQEYIRMQEKECLQTLRQTRKSAYKQKSTYNHFDKEKKEYSTVL